MNKLEPIEFSQAQRLNRSVSSLAQDKSLFYLYLSMVQLDLSEQTRFLDTDSTDEIIFADIETHHYRRASLHQEVADFEQQTSYSALVSAGDNAGLLLMKSMHPQGLAASKTPNQIEQSVIENTSYYTQQRYSPVVTDAPDNKLGQTQQVALDSTRLYELIPKASQVI